MVTNDLHNIMFSYAVPHVMFSDHKLLLLDAIQLDHHSVSVAAITTKPLLDIHHFFIGIYQYCQLYIVIVQIPSNSLLVLGSLGILDIPAPISSSEISSRGSPVLVGNLP